MPRTKKSAKAAIAPAGTLCQNCGGGCGNNGNCNDCGCIVICDPCENKNKHHKKNNKNDKFFGAGLSACLTYCLIAGLTLAIASYTVFSLEQNVRVAGLAYNVPHWGMSGQHLLVLWTLINVTLVAWFATDAVFWAIKCGPKEKDCCSPGIDWSNSRTTLLILFVVLDLIIPLAGFYLLSPAALAFVTLGALLVGLYIITHQHKHKNSGIGLILLLIVEISLLYIFLLSIHVAFTAAF